MYMLGNIIYSSYNQIIILSTKWYSLDIERNFVK